MTPSYYYDSKANKFYGPLDRMPPVMPYKDFELTNWIQYLSTLQPIPHTFTGHSHVVPEGEIEWRYEVMVDGWIGVSKGIYDQLAKHERRMVAMPIEPKLKNFGKVVSETPQEIKDSVIKKMDEQEGLVVLADLEPGSLFQFEKSVALKTEYITDAGAIEAFILGSGEMFWGGTDNAEAQRNLMVKPVPYVSAGDLKKIKAELEITGKQLYTAIEFVCSRSNATPNETGRKRQSKLRN